LESLFELRIPVGHLQTMCWYNESLVQGTQFLTWKENKQFQRHVFPNSYTE
jgi:hypothetical protein